MDVEVISVDDTGSGYCVLHLDDGSSVGQQFSRLPIDDVNGFTAALDALADAVVARIAPSPKIPLNPAIAELRGARREVGKAPLR